MNESVTIGGVGWNVLAVMTNLITGEKLIMPGRNVVTNDGDVYYAQKAAGETPTDDFAAGGLKLGTSSTTPTKTDIDVTTLGAGSGKADTFNKTNDTTVENSGGGTDIVTWKFEYASGDANITGIIEGAIVDNLVTPTAALCHFLFAASFSKTASNVLNIYVNHQFNGV